MRGVSPSQIPARWQTVRAINWLASFALASIWSLSVTNLYAQTIAEGCAAPKQPSTRRDFYVDPVKGSMTNDGSAERPWSTLADVLDGKRKLVGAPTSPIKSGDIVYLNNGDHGNVELAGVANTEFVTIQAAPGQTPTLRSLSVNGSKWVFAGLKIQGTGDGSTGSTPGPALIQFGRNQSSGGTLNIVFINNSVSTTGDTSTWTNEDWVKRPFNFGLLSSATCVSVTGNHFFNLRNAIQFDGERHLVAHNKIESFGADGIDVIASNATIRNNRITDGRHRKSDPLHPDGIQGWTKSGATNTNVLIDGNIIIKTGDPSVTEMHGIGIFDGKWENLTISNNVVVTNHWHGIAISGAANSKIINNTVVASDPRRPTWIKVAGAKDGTPSRNIIVRNNITTRLVYFGEAITADHNIIAKMIETASSGKSIYISKPGLHEGKNIIDATIYESFRAVDHSRGIYDLRPKENSLAIGRGSPDLAPRVDITGKTRNAPIDIGAFAR